MTDWIEGIRARYAYYGPTDKLKPNTAVLHIRLLLEEIDKAVHDEAEIKAQALLEAANAIEPGGTHGQSMENSIHYAENRNVARWLRRRAAKIAQGNEDQERGEEQEMKIPSDPPTFTMQPVPGRPSVVRPVLNKPIYIDPKTGSVSWGDEDPS